MRHVIRILLLLVLILPTASQASDDVLYIKELRIGTHQGVELLPEASFRKRIPAELHPVLDLPETKHTLIDPTSLLSFTQRGIKKRFHGVDTGNYKVLDNKDFADTPFLATDSIVECVGVRIVLLGRRVGLMHVNFESFDSKKFAKFISNFPEKVRTKCQVSLVSSIPSILLSDVYKTLVTGGFAVESAYVSTIYGEFSSRPGTESLQCYPYEAQGLNAADISRLRLLRQEQGHDAFLAEFQKSYRSSPKLMERPRALILNVQTGESCQIFEKGCYYGNGRILVYMNQFYQAIIMAGIPVYGYEVAMRKKLEDYLIEVRSLQKKFQTLNV
jgi:hypothetical protein